MNRLLKRALSALAALAICASAIPAVNVGAAERAEKEWNNNRRHSEEIEAGESVTGHIESMGDLDVFRFVPEKSGRITVSLKIGGEDRGLRWFIWLMDEDWKSLESSTDRESSSQKLEYKVKADETYYIVVGPWDKIDGNFSEDSSYTLKLSADKIKTVPTIMADGKKLELSGIDRLVMRYDNPAKVSVGTSDQELIAELFEALGRAKFSTSDELIADGDMLCLCSGGEEIAFISRGNGKIFIGMPKREPGSENKAASGLPSGAAYSAEDIWSDEEWSGFIAEFSAGDTSLLIALPLTNGQKGYSYIRRDGVDRVRFFTLNPNAINPETDDPELISELTDMLSGLKLGEPEYVGNPTGGTSLVIYSGDSALTLFCSEAALNFNGYLYPIISGGWDTEEWLEFVGKCDSRFDPEPYSKLLVK